MEGELAVECGGNCGAAQARRLALVERLEAEEDDAGIRRHCEAVDAQAGKCDSAFDAGLL